MDPNERTNHLERLQLENIEEIRRQEGIEDPELRAEIRSLKAGDLVKVTVLTGATSFETLTLRVTRIRGAAFHGELTHKPTSSSLATLSIGAPIDFTTAHIHSIPRKEAQS